jgi:catechol 2,3-dioxygenase
VSIDPRVDIGHVHLKVSDIDKALGFYRDILGFDVMQRMGDQAAFVSAGGYHHHLAFNVWRGRGVPGAPDDAVGLDHWTVELGDETAVAALRDRLTAAGVDHEERPDGLLVRDPWGIALLVRAG